MPTLYIVGIVIAVIIFLCIFVAGNVPTLLAKTFDTVKDATGIDLVDIVNAQSYDAQVNRHVKLDVASLPDMNKQSSQGTELKSNGTPDAPVDKK